MEQIHAVLVNLVRTYNIKYTYIDYGEMWWEILDAAAFGIFYTTNGSKDYSLGQLVLICEFILLNKHTSDCELIFQ